MYFYFSLASLIDIPGKQKILQINLIDYLENHLSNQMEQALEDMQQLKSKPSAPQTAKDAAPAFSRSEAEELELLLKEFLA